MQFKDYVIRLLQIRKRASCILAPVHKIRPPERMRLRIPAHTLAQSVNDHTNAKVNLQNPLIETNNILLSEQQVEILDRLREPKTLLLIS